MDPPEIPAWLIGPLMAKQATQPPQVPSQSRHPSTLLPDTPGDWVRNNLGWSDYLFKHGWMPVKGKLLVQAGEEPT